MRKTPLSGTVRRKYGKEKRTHIRIDVDIPESEHTILVMYANGISMNQICIEMGCDFNTVSSILRGNLREILGLKKSKSVET
jgi:DNA-binding NarL/FixJ family response regulator